MKKEHQQLAEEILSAREQKPSFAKQLFFGNVDNDLLFPFPWEDKETAQQTALYIDKIKSFADEKIDGASIDRNAKIPDVVIQGLAEIGALGMNVSKEHGGLGMSQRAYCQMTEMLAGYCASTALFINVHQSIGLKALLLFGTEAQKQKWLKPLAKGEKTAAFSLTEANAGSDASGIETRAIYDPKKNSYRITGRKQWTTNGGIADVLTVMARTEVNGEDKITAFLVTPDMPGFKVLDKNLEKVGMRGTWTANLAFEEMEVPAENILGPIGAGLRVCLTVLDYGRTTFGSTCTGVAKELVKQATHHAITRHQFGRPLASFGLIKKKIAMMTALTYAMESTTILTAGFVDSGMGDFMLESAMLKVFTSDALWGILYDTMQIFGGRSFFTDAPFERMMRDARLNMIGEGANEVMRAFIGAVGMRDVGLTLQQGIKSLSKQLLGTLLKPTIAIQSSELKAEAKTLEKGIRRFSIAVLKLLGRYREQIIEQQLELDRIATAGMALYTASAVLSRIDSALVNQSAYENELEIAKFYLAHATKQLNHTLQLILHNDDESVEELSDLITGWESDV